jgi:hypothetical protein
MKTLNRRSIIRALIATATLPALPAIAKDTEGLKRDAFRSLLAVDDKAAHNLTLLRIAAGKGHYCRAMTLELFESGMPMDEVMRHVEDRVNQNWHRAGAA